ncbi:replication protein [Rhodococcus sp. NPDC003318]|uniref:replication protein n=1 Tax=Rhodococcus sp. NPDC003318 TaxID=3364503 RepID=UPI0036BF13B5
MSEHTHTQGGIQRGPRRADNFTILTNSVINDARLSYHARGILIWLLSKPADWSTRSQAIADASPNGRESVRSGMRELQKLGYLVTEKVRDPRTGQIRTVQTVYEEPVDVAESQVIPAPKKPVTRVAEAGDAGAFTRTESPRTETNNNPARTARSARQCDAGVLSSLSEKTREILAADDQALTALEAATLAAGLPASYARIKAGQRSVIRAMINLHGIPALVEAAKRAHRPENPTVHVHGWIRLWQAMPLPRPTRPAAAPLCGQCVEGWVEDPDTGRPIRRCECRAQAVTA